MKGKNRILTSKKVGGFAKAKKKEKKEKTLSFRVVEGRRNLQGKTHLSTNRIGVI